EGDHDRSAAEVGHGFAVRLGWPRMVEDVQVERQGESYGREDKAQEQRRHQYDRVGPKGKRAHNYASVPPAVIALPSSRKGRLATMKNPASSRTDSTVSPSAANQGSRSDHTYLCSTGALKRSKVS